MEHKEKLILLFLLLLSGFLRLYRIEDYMTFLGDEGRDVLVVKHILEGHLVGLGPTASVGGFFLGPIYYYFMAPFLWLFHYNPVGPAAMVAFFGIATVYLVYFVGKEFFDIKTGFIAALLYSISPLVIAYTRSSWNPNLMPFFSLLTLYITFKAIEKNKWSLFFLSGILLGIAMQLHYLATFLGVIAVVYILLTRMLFVQGASLTKRIFGVFKEYLYVFLGFLLGWSPFLAFELKHGFPNIQSIFNFVFHSGETGGGMKFFPNIFDVFFRLFGRLLTNFPPPEQVALGAHPDVALLYWATILLGIMSVLTLLFKCFKTFKQRNLEEFQKVSLLLTWFVIGILLFGFYKKPIYDYYFGFLFPLPFMLVGATLSMLSSGIQISPFPLVYFSPQAFKKIGRILTIILTTILLYLNLQGVPFQNPPNRQLEQVKMISRFVFDKAGGKSFNFALVTNGNSDHGYRYFLELWENPPVTIENHEKDPQRRTVTNQLFVICESLPCHLLGHSLWEIAGFGRAEIVGEWDVSVVKVYKLEHYRKGS